MTTKINIDYLNLDGDYLFGITNSSIFIRVVSTDIIIYSQRLFVLYDIEPYKLNKIYYTTINYPLISTTTILENIQLPQSLKYNLVLPTVLGNPANLYIYPLTTNIPLVLLGLVNTVGKVYINVTVSSYNINYNTVISNPRSYRINLFNNYNENYFNIQGNITSINAGGLSITSSISTYNLYNALPYNIDMKTKIYFYNTLYCSIINLATMSRKKDNSIIFLIKLYNGLVELYSYITCINIDKINYLDKYIKTMYFEIGVSIVGVNTMSITMFSYDYNDYFMGTPVPLVYNMIFVLSSVNSNLYDLIIDYIGTPLIQPIIPTDICFTEDIFNPLNIQIYQVCEHYVKNIESLKLVDLISFEVEDNYVNEFFQNKVLSLHRVASYLSNYFIKDYNLYKIINSQQNISSKIINIENSITNCILIKIIFLYVGNSNERKNYELYGKLFLDNYNLEIYHIKYDFTPPPVNLYLDLLNFLLYMMVNYYQINIFFYNNPSDPVITGPIQYSNLPNPFYNFNYMSLTRINGTQLYFSLDPNNYLKFNLQIKFDYYILFFYSTVITDNELIFQVGNLYFKILKIDNPNGNLNYGTSLYYIMFANLIELNIFMKYIKTGIYQIVNVIPLDYFNITTSKNFIKNSNGFWVISDGPGSLINFTIKNLYVDQIYLYGENNINNIIV